MELAPSQVNSSSFSSDDAAVVIRASGSGRELFRETLAGRFVKWLPSSTEFVIQNGNDLHVFAPATRKPNAPAPTRAWTFKTISFGMAPDERSDSIGGYNPNEFEFLAGAIALSPDGRFAVKAVWDRGDIWWQSIDLQSGIISRFVKRGRGYALNPKSAAPKKASLSAWRPQSWRAAHFRLSLCCKPPIPIPTLLHPRNSTKAPTPTPTPQLSPGQNAFLKRTAREDAEIEKLRDRVASVNGAPPLETDPAVIQRFFELDRKRVWEREREREQLFPK
jgi:hypothetical protein